MTRSERIVLFGLLAAIVAVLAIGVWRLWDVPYLLNRIDDSTLNLDGRLLDIRKCLRGPPGDC